MLIILGNSVVFILKRMKNIFVYTTNRPYGCRSPLFFYIVYTSLCFADKKKTNQFES